MGVRLCEVVRRPADLDRLDVTTLVNEGTGDAVLRVSIVEQPNPLAGAHHAHRRGRIGGAEEGVHRCVERLRYALKGGEPGPGDVALPLAEERRWQVDACGRVPQRTNGRDGSPWPGGAGAGNGRRG